MSEGNKVNDLQKLIDFMLYMDDQTKKHTRVYSGDVQTLLSLVVNILKKIETKLEESK